MSSPVNPPGGGPAPFEISVASDDARVTVTVVGEIDIATVEAVRRATEQADGRDLVIDLGGVSFLDSSALQLFVQCQRAAQATGTSFALARPQRIAREILDIAGLAGRIPIAEDAAAPDDPPSR